MSVEPPADVVADPAVTLRAVHWQDIPILAAMESEIFGTDAWSQETWWAELAARPRRWYVVAADGAGVVLGYAGLDLGGEVADVMTIGVAPHARSRGVGSLLLDALVGAAVGEGATYLMLEVRADNDAARRLYERKGFVLLTTRRRYYQPDGVDALVLRRQLGGGSGG